LPRPKPLWLREAGAEAGDRIKSMKRVELWPRARPLGAEKLGWHVKAGETRGDISLLKSLEGRSYSDVPVAYFFI